MLVQPNKANIQSGSSIPHCHSIEGPAAVYLMIMKEKPKPKPNLNRTEMATRILIFFTVRFIVKIRNRFVPFIVGHLL